MIPFSFRLPPLALRLSLCAALAFLLVAGRGAAAHATESESVPPVATSVHVEDGPGTSRLVFEVSAPLQATAFVMTGPDRVIVDLPEVNFNIDPRAGAPVRKPANVRRRKAVTLAGLISSYRFGLFAPGKSRIVIDLSHAAKVVGVQTRPGRDGHSLLTISLAETDAASFRAAAAAATTANAPVAQLAPAQTPATEDDPARPLIVLDPGHGGIDSGAQGLSGAIEKDIVFEFSRALKAQLDETGRYRVVLTRNSDVFIPLAGRVKIARAANAALFISIHADTLAEGAGVSGATVYTVSDKASDKQAAKLAEKENAADAAAGMDGAEDGSDVSDILFDLTRRETRAYSHVFARSLVSSWSAAGKLNKNPHRSAGFMVLKAPDVPSVLLELGYLSSEKDIAVLTKPQWREKAAGIMVHAIDRFFAPRVGARGEPGTSAVAVPEASAAALH